MLFCSNVTGQLGMAGGGHVAAVPGKFSGAPSAIGTFPAKRRFPLGHELSSGCQRQVTEL